MKNLLLYLSVSLLPSFFSCANAQSNAEFRSVSPEEYHSLLEEQANPLIIDVRTSMEYKQGHIEGAKNISFIGISFKKKASLLERQNPVFIYCQTEHRSPMAARKLQDLGYTRIYDLQGGFKNWKNQSLPVEIKQ